MDALSENNDYAFLLESVENGSQYARYSYLGINPKMILSNRDGKTFSTQNNKTIKIEGSFLDILRNIQSKYNSIKISGMPSFTGGLVGYLGYETISWIENIPIHKESALNVPDSIFMLFEDIIAFDHLKGSALVISNVNVISSTNIIKQYQAANERIDLIGESLHSDLNYQTPLQLKQSNVSSNFKWVILLTHVSA